MNKLTKTGLVSLVAVVAVAMAPQAAFAKAKKVAKKHHHHVVHTYKGGKVGHKIVTHAGPMDRAPSYASAAEVAALRAELAKIKAEGAKKTEVKAVADQAAAADAAVEAKLAKHEDDTVKKNTVFFRGGYAKMSHARGTEAFMGPAGVQAGTELLVANQNPNDSGDGWYVGAGFDHRITNDMFGLTDLVAMDAELMFQYMNFGSGTNTLTGMLGAQGAPVGAPAYGFVNGGVNNKLTQFTLSASPKLKFNTGTIFTPWIIPFGLSINVISPPSNGVTVLNPGLMVGAGGEVELMKSLVAGFDFRYNFTGNDLKGDMLVRGANGRPIIYNTGTSTDGLTTGAYLGFKF